MSDDIVTVWGGIPRIGRSPAVGDLLIGMGSSTFNLGGGANDNTSLSQPAIGGDNMEVTTSGGLIRYGFAGYHGAFSSHVQQNVGGIGVPTLVTYNVTDLSYGVQVASNPSGPANTRIVVANQGVYNLQFSIQVQAAVNNTQAYLWLRKNGTDVPYSNTEVDFPNKDHGYVAAWNFLLALNANDWLELVWTATDAGTFLKDGAATYGPNIPSVIATLTLVR